MARKWLRDGVLIAALTLGGFAGGFPAGGWAREAQQGQAGGTIAVAQLPPQAVRTLNLIAAGGPYPYEKDGVVFGNRDAEPST